MKKLNCSFLAAALAAALLVSNQTQAQGVLKITEVESSEVSGSGTGNAADWFELSNFGDTSVTISGFTMADNSSNFVNSVSLTGVTTIAAGESVVFFENTGTSLTAANFRAWWASMGSQVQVGTYSGSGVGLGAGGDQVNIFDASGNLIDGVAFATATAGTTFLFNNGASGRSPTGLSQVGVGGSFTSAYGDIGSPGFVAGLTPVPEPSTMALAGISVMALAGFRRWQNRKA